MTWKIGDRPEDLDVVGSLNRFGCLVPNITTMKNVDFQIEKPVWEGKGGKLAVCMDESGSIHHQLWERIVEAAIGTVASAMEHGYPVYAVKFDKGYVEFKPEFSHDYWNLMKWLVKRRLAGGTEIRQVFEALMRLEDVAQATILILTDCGIIDVCSCGKLIEALAKKQVSFRIFMFGLNTIPSDLKTAFSRHDVKFYAVPKVDSMLSETVIRSVES